MTRSQILRSAHVGSNGTSPKGHAHLRSHRGGPHAQSRKPQKASQAHIAVASRRPLYRRGTNPRAFASFPVRVSLLAQAFDDFLYHAGISPVVEILSRLQGAAEGYITIGMSGAVLHFAPGGHVNLAAAGAAHNVTHVVGTDSASG